MSIKPIIQQITAKQQALEQGVKQMQTEKMRGIEAKADAFLTASDPIGFIGKLASEAPDEIAPVVNAARRKKKEVMQAQVPQQENVTTAGMREVLTPEPQQPPPNPRQMAIAGLPINPNMFRKAGGGIVAFQNKGFVDTLREREEGRTGYERYIRDPFRKFLIGEVDEKGDPIGGTGGVFGTPKPFTESSLYKFFTEKRDKEGKPITNLRKTDQSEEITKEELDKRIAEQDSRDPFRDQRVFEPEVKKEVEEKRQTIVPETATEAAIGEAGVGQQTTEATLVSNLEKARNILRPENVAKDGAIGQQVTDKESKLAEFKSLVNAGNAKAAAALEKEKAALAGDKKEAIYMGLLEIGLGIMGGDDPNAFVNIGKGAKAAFPSLAKSLQDVKNARRRVTDSEIKLAELENTRKIDLAKFDLDLYEKEQTRLANQKNAQLNAEVTLARTLTDADTRKAVARLQASTVGKAQLNTYKNIAYRDLIAEGKSPEEAARILQTQSGQALMLQAMQKVLGGKTDLSDEETELFEIIKKVINKS